MNAKEAPRLPLHFRRQKEVARNGTVMPAIARCSDFEHGPTSPEAGRFRQEWRPDQLRSGPHPDMPPRYIGGTGWGSGGWMRWPWRGTPGQTDHKPESPPKAYTARPANSQSRQNRRPTKPRKTLQGCDACHSVATLDDWTEFQGAGDALGNGPRLKGRGERA